MRFVPEHGPWKESNGLSIMSIFTASNPEPPLILVALGANLPSVIYGRPSSTLAAALDLLDQHRVRVIRRSRWYETAPVPMSDQPWYVNGVAEVTSDLPPEALLLALHEVESRLGRTRDVVNAARVIDLDLLDYGGRIAAGWPVLPHPRLHERAFVLRPLRDVAPQWRHPVSGLGIDAMLARLGPEQLTRPLAKGDGLP
jgi:2-amino-4-hydroxy-6-hydroxymethyldihydropteridine diphosphokinase